ncbi:MAG: DNA polymerase III subunit beta [Clostridia bacterium]|nr:DNA polymerase III subunit beta [Clostridia bacterium]
MRFTMNNQDLLEGLNTVTRALAARPAKQILDGVLLVADENRINLTCTDGSLSIEYTNVADVQEEGQVVLPGRLLTDLIRKLPGGMVEITAQNNRLASIRCMKTRSNLSIMSAAEYPEINQLRSGVPVKIPQKQLKEMISHVVFAIATDESRQILTGCLLEVSRTEARLVALDGFRLAMQKVFQPFELPEGVDMVKAIIPGKVLNELSRILPDDDAFCNLLLDQGRMQCTFGNIRLSTVLLAGEYIDYRRIVPSTFATEAKANRISVQDAIERASLMAREGKNNLVKMSFRQGVLKITSNAEMGDVEEEIEADLQGDDINIAFNAKYLIDVIRNVDEEDLLMHFNTSVSPCVVTPSSGDAFLYLILPVRVFQ